MKPSFWKEVVIEDNQKTYLERIQACIDALGGYCPACRRELTTSNTNVDNWFSRISHWGCARQGGGRCQATQVADFLVLKADGSYVRGIDDPPFPALQPMVDRLKRRKVKVVGKSFAFCERCHAKLASESIWWLELDQRTGTYTLEAVPEEFSQGGFPFGKDCAKIMLAEHAAAKQPKKECEQEE